MGADPTPDGEQPPEPEENWDLTAVDWASLPLDDPAWDALDDLDIDVGGDGPPGTPPDPSQRSWRHPSEVAAARAHLERSNLDDAKRVHPAGGLVTASRQGNGRLLLTVAAGVLIVAAVAIRSLDEDTMLAESAAMTVTTSGAVVAPSTSSQPRPTIPVITVFASDPDPDPAVEPARVYEPRRLPPAYAFEVMSGDDEFTSAPIGTALRLDGLAPDLLVTSATALAGRSSVTLASYAATPDRPRLVEATLVAEDQSSDIALLRIVDARSLVATSAPLDTARRNAVGSDVQIQAGQPHGQHAGKVLGVDETSIETSASVPIGHLGSAVVSKAGRVMGIVVNGPSMLATAIPVDVAAEVAQNLADYGHASPNWLGMTVTSAEGLVEVVAVASLGPAELAGITSGDRLLGASGQLITSPYQLAEFVSNAVMDESIDVVIERQGSVESVQIVIGERPRLERGPIHIDT